MVKASKAELNAKLTFTNVSISFVIANCIYYALSISDKMFLEVFVIITPLSVCILACKETVNLTF